MYQALFSLTDLKFAPEYIVCVPTTSKFLIRNVLIKIIPGIPTMKRIISSFLNIRIGTLYDVLFFNLFPPDLFPADPYRTSAYIYSKLLFLYM